MFLRKREFDVQRIKLIFSPKLKERRRGNKMSYLTYMLMSRWALTIPRKDMQDAAWSYSVATHNLNYTDLFLHSLQSFLSSYKRHSKTLLRAMIS